MLPEVRARTLELLRWSEKYTKTDMVYLIRGSGLSLISQGTGLVASLVLAIAVGRFVPKEIYGSYKFVLSIVSILSLFSLTGLGDAVFLSAARGLDGALPQGFWDNIRWSGAVFVGGLAVALYYFLHGQIAIGLGVFFGASLSPFIASGSLFSPFLNGKKDFARLSLYGITDNVLPIIVLIGVVLFTSNLMILVLSYFLMNAVAAIFFYRRTVHAYHASLHMHDHDLPNYSKHLSAMGIMSGLGDNLDQLLLFHFVGATQLAVYNFATAIPDQFKGPLKNLGAMLGARFATRSASQIQHSIRNKVLWYLLGTSLAAIAYITVAPFIFHTLFPRYADAVLYSQIYVTWILSSTFDPFHAYLWTRKLKSKLYILTVFYFCFQIASMLIGVIAAGVLALVIARVATRISQGLVGYALYRHAITREAQ